MPKPVTIPNTFATATTAIPLTNLDADFTAVASTVNDANSYSNYAADTGAANAYVVTLTGITTTYNAGLRIQFKALNANTTASTVNVNGQGAKNITYQDATAIASGTIAANSIVDVMYDGTQFLLMNDPAGATGGDVVGPASATDNAVVRFDGTTGKLVQNSVVTIADSTGDVTGVGALTMGGNLTLNGGTANGVLYLNGSKMATSGSALTFDGTNLLQVNAVAGKLRLGVNTSDQFLDIYRDNASGASVYNAAQGAGFGFHVWQVANTEQMRLNSTGLGIGTSNLITKFTVQDTERFEVGGGSGFTYNQSVNAARSATVEHRSYGLFLTFGTGAAGSQAERMRLDSSGNLGLGVTPSASNIPTFQSSVAVLVGTSEVDITSNAYYNSGWKYVGTGAATQYQANGGLHKWFTAPSGTAGNAITFTQALTLDASGNLLLGGTNAGASSAASLAIFNGTAPTGSVTNGIILYAEDVSSSSELKVRDEAGNVTTLSPHNFSLIPDGPSEDMAWAYYSEKGGKRINVDMLKLARMVEKLTGEKLVYES